MNAAINLLVCALIVWVCINFLVPHLPSPLDEIANAVIIVVALVFVGSTLWAYKNRV